MKIETKYDIGQKVWIVASVMFLKTCPACDGTGKSRIQADNCWMCSGRKQIMDRREYQAMHTTITAINTENRVDCEQQVSYCTENHYTVTDADCFLSEDEAQYQAILRQGKHNRNMIGRQP